MNILQNKTAYITGGSKGVGYGIAKILLQNGMNVAITGRNLSAVEAAAASLTTDSSKILAIQSNVSDMKDEVKAIESTVAKFGKIDVVVANAGVGYFVPFDDLTEAQWHEMLDTNLTGVFNTVKAALNELKKNRGYVITISSLAGTNFFENGSGYNASKFGLVGFTQAMMLDLRKHGIKTTTIMPGSVATYFNNHIPSAEDAWKIQPEDIGELVADVLKIPERTLPSKIEVRPSIPHKLD
ncbi:MAG: SDR family oxidoreductase [Chitinophagaceae bacterium]|jgi:NAD(P)-dependent dehydrogenase (short-subunit alcohol dehydrogenase family)|nr:SDR family oxidoreductase [Chitinophagaceae bacterium]MBP6047440.1 SDR family oxidoreductase [Ferruginibacter sp.]MBK7346673.1 SDR family oxidoreductase [Chitinophagaceae bacterium]MBK8928461.1 SDR family oxidoreductase [Chitinophagaceae bacterium]MBP6987795.1 SDR family oxidoreductase [Ferruginibacter sp.]